MIEVLNVVKPRQEDPPVPVNTADVETKMDTQTMDRENPKPQMSIGHASEGEDVKDIPFAIEILETNNTTTCMDVPTRDIHIEDTGSRATPLGREHAKENPSDGETQMAPLQLSQKRNKKLKMDRDTPLSRNNAH